MRQVRFMLLSIGMLICLFAVGMTIASAPVQAQSLPDRPTLTPVPQPSSSSEERPTAVPSGRITGTVIDVTTGAPAPGITVSVGGVLITSDSNGNYDRSGLSAGDYQVALVLTSAQGQAEQGTITVSLADGATAVQHLRFRSPVAVAPTAVPVPAALPQTGGNDGGPGLFAFGVVLMLAAGLLRRRA